MSRLLLNKGARGLWVAVAIAALSLSACREDSPVVEPRPGPGPAAGRITDPAVSMMIVVSDARGDASIDANAVRTALHDAETALLSCADADGSTGVIVLRIAIEHDGSVGELALRETTTYGSEEARACMQRIVGAMRFASPGSERAEIEVTLEVRTRFAPNRP